jgi:hypothetical protein
MEVQGEAKREVALRKMRKMIIVNQRLILLIVLLRL